MNRHIGIVITTISLVLLGFFTSINANAAMVTTEKVVDKVHTSVSRDQILVTLEREDVRKILVAKGVDINDARARIDAMNDAEIASLQQDFDSLPAGAGAGSILVTVVLVFVILDIVGVTNVFTFIN